MSITIPKSLRDKIEINIALYNTPHASTSVFLSDIIQAAKITRKDFEAYVKRTREIFTDLYDGNLEKFHIEILLDKIWPQLIKHANQLKMDDNPGLISLINDVYSRNLRVPEIHNWINKKMGIAVKAIDKAKKASSFARLLYEIVNGSQKQTGGAK